MKLPVKIMVLIFDSLRADHLPCYGYERDTAPNICSLVRDGVLFKNAFSQGTETFLSIPSMLFSKFPILSMASMRDTAFDSQSTIIEVLEKNGFNISIFTDHEWLADRLRRKNINNIYSSFDNLVNSLNSRKPTFILLHLMDVHWPYNSMQRTKFHNSISSLNKNAVIDKILQYNNTKEIDDYPKITFTQEEIRYIKNIYDEAIIEADGRVGKILDLLTKMKVYNDTLIIICSDHGEGFGEHNLFFHSNKPCNELIHVPLIIKFPNNKYSGKAIEQVVRNVDITPTIFDSLNLKNEMKSEGVSLIPAIEGKDLNLVIYSEYSGSFAFGNRSYIYISKFRNESDELYNLEKDPQEKYNLIDKYPKLADELREKAIKFQNSLGRVMPLKANLSEEIKEKLKELGYVQ